MNEGFGCLFQLLWLPYQAWKRITEESRLGTSEMDRQSGRVWWKFAVISTLVMIAIVIAVAVFSASNPSK